MAPKIQPKLQRFWKYVSKTFECWEWMSAKDKDGYGKLWDNETKSQSRAHRYSWEIHNHRDLMKGEMICHTCDNPSCVNPEHLYLGDAFTNQQDAVKRNRHWEVRKTHCAQGHEFIDDNTYVWRSTRKCRECNRINLRKKYYGHRQPPV